MLVAVWAAIARGQGKSPALTLDEALERARTQSPLLRAAGAEVDAAKGRLMQAGTIPANPVLKGDLARHSTIEPSTVNLDRGVELEQEIEVGGQRGLRVGAARHDVARAEQLLADTRRTVEADVRRAFAALVAADRRLVLGRESVGVAARLVEATERRARAGDVADLDLQLARIEASRAEQAVAAATAERAGATARLAAAIGAGPDEDVEVAGIEGDVAVSPAPESELVSRALAARPDLAAAREAHAQLVGEADVTRRVGLVPNPLLKGWYRQELNEEHIAGGGVDIPLPIFNRGQGTEVAQRAAAAGAASEVERLEREIPREVHTALARHAVASASWTRYQRDVLPAVRTARELLERGFEQGYLGLRDVLAQRDRLVGARVDAITIWLSLAEADADLRAAVGEDIR